MPRLQQLTVFISSVGTPLVRHHAHPRLLSKKTAIGNLWEIWLNLDLDMVRSPQSLQQWL